MGEVVGDRRFGILVCSLLLVKFVEFMHYYRSFLVQVAVPVKGR